MTMRLGSVWSVVIVASLSGCASVWQLPTETDTQAAAPAAAHTQTPTTETDTPKEPQVSANPEELYVFRSTRTGYVSGATAACAAAPFSSASEQHYETWSVSLRSSDARIVNPRRTKVGEFVSCFGAAGSDGSFPMYASGSHGTIGYHALGECRFMKSKPPAEKLLVLSCRADLSELPASYEGGDLTTSSLAPSGGADAVDVAGYVSTSIITMRLWKGPK